MAPDKRIAGRKDANCRKTTLLGNMSDMERRMDMGGDREFFTCDSHGHRAMKKGFTMYSGSCSSRQIRATHFDQCCTCAALAGAGGGAPLSLPTPTPKKFF